MLLDLHLKGWKLKQKLKDEDYVDDFAYDDKSVSAKAKRFAWARLIKKVYKLLPMICPKCLILSVF